MSWNIAKPGDQINGPVAVTGNLNVDSNTLFVDSANNRVGVLTASPTVPLDVVGDAKVSGNLTVDTNTLVVDAANNRLGIGTATPSYKVDVAATGAILASAPFSVARITGANAVANDLTLSGPNTSQVRLNFGDPENSGVGEIGYNHASNLMRFVVNNGQVHTLEPSGVFTWYDGAGGTRMTLNGTGLGVGVVPTAAAIHSAKATAANPTGGSAANAGLYVSAVNQLYGMMFGVNGVGAGWIQQQRSDATNTQYDLSLQPLGGNVGIGIATPTSVNANAKTLHVDGAANAAEIRVTNNTTGIASTDGGLLMMAAANLYLQNKENASLLLGTNGTDRLIIDGSGNAGLGVTPSAGYSGVSVLELGSLGSTLMSGGTFGGTVYLGQNSYYNGTWRFARASAACLFGQNNDKSFAWYQSSNATPTVGGAITWTQAMTLDASGRLLLGTASARSNFFNSSVTTQLQVEGDGAASFVRNVNDVYGGVLVLGKIRGASIVQNNDRVSQISFQGSDGTEFVECANISADIDGAPGANDMPGRLVFSTTSDGAAAPTERLRIKSTGQVNFNGLASDPAGAAAGDVYYNTTTNKLKCYNGTTWNDLF